MAFSEDKNIYFRKKEWSIKLYGYSSPLYEIFDANGFSKSKIIEILRIKQDLWKDAFSPSPRRAG